MSSATDAAHRCMDRVHRAQAPEARPDVFSNLRGHKALRALARRHASPRDPHSMWHNICVYIRSETWTTRVQAVTDQDRPGCRRPADPATLRPDRSIDNGIQGARHSSVHWCHEPGQWVLLLPPWLLSSIRIGIRRRLPIGHTLIMPGRDL